MATRSRFVNELAGIRRRRARATWASMAPLAVLLYALLQLPLQAQDFGEWSAARSVDPLRQLGVNTPVNDGCPIEGPDERMLFFASNRDPRSSDPHARKDLDIWVAYRDSEGSPWLAPEPLPVPVNTGAQEFCPTPLPGNQLLFVSTRTNNCGGSANADIYYTRLHLHQGRWAEPVPLPCTINSPFEEFSPSLVEDDGMAVLFFSSNRTSGAAGVHRIYSSVRQPDGSWGEAQPVDELNIGPSNARPNVRRDGLEIFFDSNAEGTFDIYTATRTHILGEWSAPTQPTDVNDPMHQETRASLSRDGSRLYFGSTRANPVLGGVDGDIFVSTRSGPDPGRGRGAGH